MTPDDTTNEQNGEQTDEQRASASRSPLSNLLRGYGQGNDNSGPEGEDDETPMVGPDTGSGLGNEDVAGAAPNGAGRLPPRASDVGERSPFDPHTLTEFQLMAASPLVARAISAALLAHEHSLNDAPPLRPTYPEGYDPDDCGATEPIEAELGGPRKDSQWMYYPVTTPDVLGSYSVAWAREAIDRWTTQGIDLDGLWHPEVALREDDGLPGDETSELDGLDDEPQRERLDRFEREVGTSPGERSDLTLADGPRHDGVYDPTVDEDEGRFRADPDCRHCIIFSPSSAKQGVRDLPLTDDGRTPADIVAKRYNLNDEDESDGNSGIATTFSGP